MKGRQPIFAAITLLVVLGVTAVFVDALLRVRPTLFGQHLGNYVFSRYGTAPGEIYFYVPELGQRFMWPDFETRAYYNGWSWSHRTDARGFRNPPDRESEVLLLGDSLIYGHGVELDEGVSELLHDRYGWQTYNLAQQGDGLPHSYARTRLFAEELAPRVIVYFAFMNDVGDLESERTDAEIEDAPRLARDDWPALRAEIAARGRAGGERAGLSALPAVRFFGGLWHELSERRRRAAGVDPAGVFSAPLLDPARRARAERYYVRVLGDLAARSRALGAELVVVHLDVLDFLDPAVRASFRRLVETAARESGAHFFDTGEVLTGCPECVLVNDGHLSPKGHAVLAEMVDGWLRTVDANGSSPP